MTRSRIHGALLAFSLAGCLGVLDLDRFEQAAGEGSGAGAEGAGAESGGAGAQAGGAGAQSGGAGGQGAAPLNELGEPCEQSSDCAADTSCPNGSCLCTDEGVCCTKACAGVCNKCADGGVDCVPYEAGTSAGDCPDQKQCQGHTSKCVYGWNLWSKQFGDGAAGDEATAVGVAYDGAIVVAGNFDGSLDLGGNCPPLGPAVDLDAFVAKLDDLGECQWAVALGGPANQQISDLALHDSNAHIVVVGITHGELDLEALGAGTNPSHGGGADAFVVALTPDGAYQWGKVYGPDSAQYASAVTFDATGAIHVAGGFTTAIEFAGGSSYNLTAAAGNGDAYVVKLDPNSGSAAAVYQAASSNQGTNNQAKSVDLQLAPGSSSDDVVWLAGVFNGKVNFGAGPATSADYDIFLVSLDTDDLLRDQVRTYGAAGDQFVSALGRLSDGRLMMAGDFAGTLDFGVGALPTQGDDSSDIYVARLAADAADDTSNWATSFVGFGDQRVLDLTVDGTDNFIIAGHFENSVQVMAVGLTASAQNDVLLASFEVPASSADPPGLRWAHGYGHGGQQQAQAVATTPTGGEVVAAGAFGGELDFGTLLMTAPDRDIFVARFVAFGNP